MPRSAYNHAYATLVAGLVEARKQAGVTQVELTHRLGKPQSFISKIERGERRIDIVEFCAVARALGLTPSALLHRIDATLPADLSGEI